ncbi:His-Xaa-Ser system radical SAM maturase HxsB [Sphingomonas sp. BGYR3]|uniref:His-Xaa-Ser system radical SAM maturase HxsB n=1 Tax=Sphingomonas sp. BGYR3 TaxID=2975483 RepID=UPI0021A5B871|nr:His-Xaa-Ser system radical SAM maturase HxsB [Sphingomonas sp. BGYR3]MDG5488866.1 His-Xaa-Ser system radical SAM maturase HxsB [Sphingomonas sp. BGYR3]
MPLRTRLMSTDRALLVNDGGGFFSATPDFLDRLSAGTLSSFERQFVLERGHGVDRADPLGETAHLYNVAERLTLAGPLDYLILVPTLRCNLSCTYCQVSRAALDQTKYDWNDATLEKVLSLIDGLSGPRIKIEFQGGEPTLRPDLIRAVIDRTCRFEERQFVICTNLQNLGPEILSLFDGPEVFISTSLDGDFETHLRNRTTNVEMTGQFRRNLATVVERYGPQKVSALPTIDPERPPTPDALIDAYLEFGLESIFLRPINYQGFARKHHASSREQDMAWRAYHEKFLRRLIERNWEDRSVVLEESYFSICLRRIFQPGADRHVDLRNPNPLGYDYVVIDYDGQVYPTDEARMLSRSGVIDLSIGDVHSGWDTPARATLNAHASNLFDPACQRCAYQPYCGRDVVDDIARYGRIDLPRQETEFCRRHMSLFDLAFRLIYADDEPTRYSLARWLRLEGTPLTFGEHCA